MSRLTRPWSIRQLAVRLFPAVLVGVLIGCGTENKPPPVANNSPQSNKGASTVEPSRPLAEGEKGEKDGAEQLSKSFDHQRDLRTPIPAGKPDGLASEKSPLTEGFAGGKPSSGLGGLGSLNGGGLGGGGLPAPGTPPVSASAPSVNMPHPSLPSPIVLGSGLNGRSGATKDSPIPTGGGSRAMKLKAIADPQVQVAQGQPGQPPAAGDPVTGESYNMYKENEYRSPLVAPLSTFSADVNTASFSNVRRMLASGQMPPKDAVFLAEFINYFPYDYAKPKGEDPIAYNLELGPCPWNRQHHLLRVGVQSITMDPKDMPARRFTFLIDTSGSMSGPNRLPLVKQSLGLLIDQMGEKDSVSIVTYASSPGVALAPTPGTEKEKIRAAVEGLGAGGSTNGEGGLKAAYELARQTFQDKAVNRVILCTDGDFNVGQSSQGELVRMIEDQRKSGVFLTILGFGMGNYKDGMLKELANHGNGHHAYIDTIDEAKKVFVEQGGALVLVAKDVKFQVDFNPARVAAYRLVGYENRLLKDEDFKNDAKDAGDMGSGHQVTVLYELVPVGVKIELPGVDKSKYQIPTTIDPKAPDEWLTVKMRYKQPDEDKSKELVQPLKGDAKAKDLSDDFRFSAAAASFGMLLRDSEFKGGMTLAGVLEEAQGAVGSDPAGHRKAFLDMIKQAQELQKSKAPATPAGAPAN